MFRDCNEIAFEAGDILSAQMLEETYRYPREFLHLLHSSYSDGIVSGLDFDSRSDGVYLTAGIVKRQGKFYILPEDVYLDGWLREQSLSGGMEYFLCLEDDGTIEDGTPDCGVKSKTRIVMKVFSANKPENSLLLGKFRFDLNRLRVPIVHYDTEKPFDDFFQSGLLYLLNTEYAHPQGGTTYPPLLFRALQSFLEQKLPLSPYDFGLLMEIQNHGIVSIPSLRTYISAHDANNHLPQEMTREILFQELTRCVQMPYQAVAVHVTEQINERKTEHQSEWGNKWAYD